ncbi:MAG: AMP-binding protein [Bacteroidia bacterium]
MFLSEASYPENRIAVTTDNGMFYSYADINNFRETIQKHIPFRCLVFSLCGNTTGSLFGYVSFISNSIVPVMLGAGIESRFLEDLINTYHPVYIWLPNERVNEFTGYAVVYSAYEYSLVKLEEQNIFSLHPELAILLTTSGSTGSSKFVRISYENLRSNVETISAYLSIDEQERPVTTLPMWYSYGLSVINCHIMKGATILLTSKTTVEKDFWSFLKKEKASSLAGVPYTFQILKKLKFSEMDLPSLKTLTLAGGSLAKDVTRYISEYAVISGKRFFVMYGQTEATARMSYLPPEYAITKPGSIGLPVIGGAFSLIDDTGNELRQPGQVGELVYKGKNVSMGYSLHGQDLLKGNENNGILFTGDLGRTDEDGFYYLTGRKNRDIKLYGNRVNLDETENLLAGIIPDCACIGMEDNMSVFITDKSRLAEIRNYLSSKTGIHSSAFTIRHCDEIPKNGFGKTNYSRLENL